jgi:hypothetical protein
MAAGLRGSVPQLQCTARGRMRPDRMAHGCHICAGTGLTPATSAPGPGSPLPHLRRDWAHPCPHLRRDWAHPCPHLRRDWAAPAVHRVLGAVAILDGPARGGGECLPSHVASCATRVASCDAAVTLAVAASHVRAALWLRLYGLLRVGGLLVILARMAHAARCVGSGISRAPALTTCSLLSRACKSE